MSCLYSGGSGRCKAYQKETDFVYGGTVMDSYIMYIFDTRRLPVLHIGDV